MSAVVSSSTSREVASPALPIGVAASTIRPGPPATGTPEPAVRAPERGAVLDVAGPGSSPGRIRGSAEFGVHTTSLLPAGAAGRKR